MPRSVRLGWLAVPAFLAVLVLIGLGLSTEGRADFERRTADSGQGGPGDRIEQARPGDQGRIAPAPDGAESGDGATVDAEDGELGRGSEITVATETGEIVIQVDEDGRPIRLTPVGPDGTGDAVDVYPEDLVAIRLTEDGKLEVVPLDQVGPDDTVVVSADGGFDLRRPDGSIVEFRGDGENGGITATEISPDGEVTELVPNPDGSVTLSDGTTVGPIDVVENLGPIERLIEQTRELPWPWLAAAVVLLALGSIALAYHLHRRRSDETFDFGQLAGSEVSDDRFEQFLDSLAGDRDPSRAIRVGFSVAERGLGGIAGRRSDETPFEWHRRIAEAATGTNHTDGSGERADTLGTVCDLFARARFAPGQSTEDDRRAMIDGLRRLHQLGRRPTDPAAREEPDRQPERQGA